MTRDDILQHFKQDASTLLWCVEQLSLLQNLDATLTKEEGVTYTPWNVAYSMVQQLDIQASESWLDTSIGRGIYLWATLQYLQDTGASSKDLQYFIDHLQAGEWDPVAAQDTRDLLDIWCAHHQLTPPAPSWIQVGDSLHHDRVWQVADVMVGNPPYVRIQNLDTAARVTLRKYSTCAQGNVDLYYGFFEHALRYAKRGALIAPNSWLNNKSAQTLRDLMLARTVSVEDFYEHLLFAPVRAYTAIWQWGEDNTPTMTRYAPWRHRHLVQEKNSLTGVAWPDPLRTGTTDVSTYPTLDSLAQIHSGIATLADKIYQVTVTAYGANHCDALCCDGVTRSLETALLVPCYKWTKDQQANPLSSGSRAMIYPYDAQGKILDVTWMSTKAPKVYAWLLSQQSVLAQRDKGKGNYDAWYAYGRRQGLYKKMTQAWGVPTMWHQGIQPVVIAAPNQSFVFVSGYVVEPKPGVDPTKLLQALTAPCVWEQVLVQGKIWAGDKPYRTIGAPLLRTLRVPYP